MCPIDYKVKTGDVVDIIPTNSTNLGLSAWLNIIQNRRSAIKSCMV